MEGMELEEVVRSMVPTLSLWVFRIVGVLVGVLLAMAVSSIVERITLAALGRAEVDPTVRRFAGQMARWVVLLCAIVALLGVFGLETTSFAAAIGAAGLAIGLAFQGSLSNLAAGVMLLVFRPFKIGDAVSVAGESGTVAAIELMATTIDTPDRRRIFVPNSQVFGSKIENISFHPVRRSEVKVGVAYDADVETARAALRKAVDDIEDQAEGFEPAVVLTGLSASSVDFAVRVYVASSRLGAVNDQLTAAVKLRLEEAGVGIPYPQMDVHLDPRGKAA